MELRNDEPHLKPPVSEMHVADHFMSRKAADPFNALPDDRGPQVSHMKGLGDIGTAVIDDHLLFFRRERRAKAVRRSHFPEVFCQKSLLYPEIQKSRPDRRDLRKHGILIFPKLPRDRLRDL